MRFFSTIFAGAALVAAALAVEINEFPSEVQAGRTYRITYTPGDDTPTTFILRKGANEDLDTITTLTTTATGGEFQWAVDSSLEDADDYALEIKQGTESNYIGPIALTGGSEPKPSSSSAASSSPSSTAASTSSDLVSTTVSVSVSTFITGVPTPSGNGTNIPSLTRTPSSTRGPSETETQGPPESTGAASAFSSSPLALVFGAVAAMAYLN